MMAEYNELRICQEQPENFKEVYNVVKSAFASAEHADGNEQDLVGALRLGTAYIPELSLAAYKNGRIVGHILFTRMMVGSSTVLALAPLSVLPEYQGQGIGTALINEGHKRAAALGYDYAVVLGSETYYPRFGYQPASVFGIEIPDGFPEENFMACQLRAGAAPLSGAVKYADEFGI